MVPSTLAPVFRFCIPAIDVLETCEKVSSASSRDRLMEAEFSFRADLLVRVSDMSSFRPCSVVWIRVPFTLFALSSPYLVEPGGGKESF